MHMKQFETDLRRHEVQCHNVGLMIECQKEQAERADAETEDIFTRLANRNVKAQQVERYRDCDTYNRRLTVMGFEWINDVNLASRAQMTYAAMTDIKYPLN